MMVPEFRYFECATGHVVPRWGIRETYIGCHRTADGYVWQDSEVVAIPVSELKAFHREYSRCLKEGALIEKRKSDFEAFIKYQTEQSAKDSKKKIDTDKPPKRKGSYKSASTNEDGMSG